MFPVAVEDLVGQYVLLIGIDEANPRHVSIAAGFAAWRESEFAVSRSGPSTTLVVRGQASGLRGFDPAVLPELFMREARAAVLRESRGCSAGVVGFLQRAIGAVELVDPLFGLAVNSATGEIFLMQGQNSDADSA